MPSAAPPHPGTQLRGPQGGSLSCVWSLWPRPSLPAHAHCRPQQTLPLTLHLHLPSAQFLVSRLMVCWSLDFHLPVSTSTAVGLSHLHLLLRHPQITLEPQPLPMTLEGKVVISINFAGAGALAVLAPRAAPVGSQP